MKSGLLRVLHVRRLLEELAALELRTRTAELHQLEARAEEQRRLAEEARNQALQTTMARDAADSWLGMADAEIFSWKRKQMEVAAGKARKAIVDARERMQSRRIETQQAGTLVSKAERAEDYDRNRREQQRIDDRYQSLPSSDSRRSK